MSLTHCPLCIALAVVSVARGLGLAVLLWQLRAADPGAREAGTGWPWPGILSTVG